MKRNFLITSVLTVMLFISGCSATWSGVKKDSSDAWEATKRTVNEITGD